MLKLGKMSAEAIAKWMGRSRTYFKTHKEECFATLSKYCKFHLVKTGHGESIYIDEIYIADFQGFNGPPARERVKELTYTNWSETGLDTCTNVAKKNYPMLKDEGYEISKETNYRYTCVGRTELWGCPAKRTEGSKVRSRYEYCKVDEQGNLVPFTEEEQKIKEELIKKYFGNLSEWTLGIADDLKRGRISKEEAADALEGLDEHGEYTCWLGELEARIGAPIRKATRIQENTPRYSAF